MKSQRKGISIGLSVIFVLIILARLSFEYVFDIAECPPFVSLFFENTVLFISVELLLLLIITLIRNSANINVCQQEIERHCDRIVSDRLGKNIEELTECLSKLDRDISSRKLFAELQSIHASLKHLEDLATTSMDAFKDE